MPEPPHLAPLDAEEQRLYFESLPNDRAPHPISKGEPDHRAEETHFDIRADFSKAEWVRLRRCEKVHYRNMKRNHQAMLDMGRLRAPASVMVTKGDWIHAHKQQTHETQGKHWRCKKILIPMLSYK
uniref:KRAB-related domain-containing protein n=1 Tax=Paramormyrops kingsleyae TaxID=1676925 RepID=A0A3B3SA31_9TELE